MSNAKTHTIEYDLRFLESGLTDLERYLLSQEIYWPVSARPPAGDPPYPRLTLGNLLLSQRRLHARSLASDQNARLESFEGRMEETRTHWLTAWRQKAQREFSMRLHLWRDYLEDYRQNPSANADRYAYEINRRVILDLLEPQAASFPPAETGLLLRLDGMLHARFVSGDFVWDKVYEAGFPASKYWYLYGHPEGE